MSEDLYLLEFYSRQLMKHNSLKKILDGILTTACYSSVYGDHSFMAVTTLCAFLRKLEFSEYHLQLLWKDSYWIRCFDVFLEKSESTKAKPMKRLLTTLIAERSEGVV